MDTHCAERELRDATRKAAWDSAAGRSAAQVYDSQEGSLTDAAKYQFEPDSEDDKIEKEIDYNLGMFYIHGDSDS
jgi:hypothetical protein